MSDDKHGSIRRIFDEAIGVAGPERAGVLDRACAGNADLRRRVEAMLAAAEDDNGFLSSPTSDHPQATIFEPLREGAGTRIGPYKLLQQIGEGGFGVVFMAEQQSPVVRRVALKIIKLGMDTRQVIARFEAERQALAMMDHPNIARVLDAGATETGRPYFVMELVKGDPIVTYCDRDNLTLEERLALFVQVCRAVQHAHTKGIIHRDLKPGNVLVGTQDGNPHAKVIDFGIAKATEHRLTEKTLFTEHRNLIGTPEYMSPEQAEGSLDIDTRTDVYSLGVMLYELLTGSVPFESARLRSAAFAEVQRIIREEEPVRPSVRLSRSAETIAGLAAHRRMEPGRLGASLRGDLDWVVMKCLDKNRSRRYDTAAALAADVERHLTGQPVNAAPPSTGYRLRKFVRRHRGPVTAGALVLLALVAGLAVSTWMAVLLGRAVSRTRDAESDARRQRDAALAAEGSAREQAQRAEREADRSRRISEALQEMLGAAGPAQSVATRPDPEARLTQFRALFGDDDATVGVLMASWGAILSTSGDLPGAESALRMALEIQRRSLGERHATVAGTLTALGKVLRQQQKLAEAIGVLTLAVEIRRAAPAGAEPISVGGAPTGAGAGGQGEAGLEPLAESCWALAEAMLGRDESGADPQVDAALRDAVTTAQRAYGPDNAEAANRQCMYALWKHQSSPSRESEAALLEAVERARRTLPAWSQYRIQTLNQLVIALMTRRDVEATRPLFAELMDLVRQSQPGTAGLALGLLNYAAWLQPNGDGAKAIDVAAESVAIFDALPDAGFDNHLLALQVLVSAQAALKQYDDAERTGRRVVAMLEERPDRLLGKSGLVWTLAQLGAGLLEREERRADAAADIERAIALIPPGTVGDEGAFTARVVRFNTLAQEKGRDPAQVGSWLRELVGDVRALDAPGQQRRLFWIDRASTHFFEQSDWAAARDLARSLLDTEYTPADSDARTRTTALLAICLLKLGELADAETAARQTLEWRTRDLPEGSVWTASSRSILGAVLAAQGRFEESDAALRQAWSAQDTSAATPVRLKKDTAARLADLYQRWHAAAPQPERETEAARWAAIAQSLKDEQASPGGG